MDLNFGAAVLGGIQGQVGSIIKSYFELKRHKINAKYKAAESIRNVRYKPFVFLQSLVALMIISYVCFLPFLAAYMGITIEMAYIETNGFVKAAFTGLESIHWNSVNGFPLGPVHIYLASSVSFYLMGTRGR